MRTTHESEGRTAHNSRHAKNAPNTTGGDLDTRPAAQPGEVKLSASLNDSRRNASACFTRSASLRCARCCATTRSKATLNAASVASAAYPCEAQNSRYAWKAACPFGERESPSR